MAMPKAAFIKKNLHNATAIFKLKQINRALLLEKPTHLLTEGVYTNDNNEKP
jgi:hypothetical protein